MCNHFRGEIDGESDDIYKDELVKHCSASEKSLTILKDKYAKKREIMKLLNGYGYSNR
ncbi:hypothetical protein AGMMS50229_02780 [Campylobacterota bacterium]|nr:hypothetical protein AGMMS50229_02780 [Campylobacterota bacterium]